MQERNKRHRDPVLIRAQLEAKSVVVRRSVTGLRRLFVRVRIERRREGQPLTSFHPSRTVMRAVVRTSGLLARNHWRTFASTSARRTDVSGPAPSAATIAGTVNPISPPRLKEGLLYIDTVFPLRIATWE